jgi:hypothetical protein
VPDGGYVSRRLLQLVMPIFPDRRMFRIHDPEVSPDGPGAPLIPIDVLMTATREQLWIGSLQQDIDVRLVLEEWDGQPLLPDAWDEEAKARLYLRGQLTVDMGAAGTAVQRLRLSGGVGDYEVRVYEELFRNHKDPLSDDFQREKRKLEGVERYLVQLWRDSLPCPAPRRVRLSGRVGGRCHRADGSLDGLVGGGRPGGPGGARGFRASRPGMAGAVRSGRDPGRRGRGARGGARRRAGLRGRARRNWAGSLRAGDGLWTRNGTIA